MIWIISSLNQIKCHKNHFLYLKLILLLSGDISLSPGPIQNDHLKENWKETYILYTLFIQKQGPTFYTFEYKQFTAKNWWTKRNSKNIKLSGYWHYRNEIRSFDWWFRNSLDASTDTVPFDVIETERVDV